MDLLRYDDIVDMGCRNFLPKGVGMIQRVYIYIHLELIQKFCLQKEWPFPIKMCIYTYIFIYTHTFIHYNIHLEVATDIAGLMITLMARLELEPIVFP